MDRVHKTRNVSAILRTCDAVGVLEAHAVWPEPEIALHRLTSGSAINWVPVHTHPTIADAVTRLRARGLRIVAAHACAAALDFRAIDYTRPTAILLGAELRGVSDAGLSLADEHIEIPLHGMVSALNVAVAAAVILIEAERQRSAAGMYARTRLDDGRYRRVLFEWAYPRVAAHCRSHHLPYPALDGNGVIVSGND